MHIIIHKWTLTLPSYLAFNSPGAGGGLGCRTTNIALMEVFSRKVCEIGSQVKKFKNTPSSIKIPKTDMAPFRA
jgi:hypothetical protein